MKLLRCFSFLLYCFFYFILFADIKHVQDKILIHAATLRSFHKSLSDNLSKNQYYCLQELYMIVFRIGTRVNNRQFAERRNRFSVLHNI